MDHILILSGSPKENIDGVRYYANRARPEHHGLEAANILQAKDFKVTLVAPNQSIISGQDLINAAVNYAGQSDIKAVLQLANISSIRPAQISAQKLKVKKETGQAVPMGVVGNVDARARLEAAFPAIPVIGYHFRKIIATMHNPLVETLVSVIPAKAGILADNIPVHTSPELDTGFRRYDSALAGKKIIITSGPTAERLTTSGDVITNISSGRQGLTTAEALADMGAQVIFITGPTALPDPAHTNIITLHAIDARDMYLHVMANLPADAYIGVAAIADFGIESTVDLRLKEGEPATLQLVQNPDILQIIGTHATLRPKVVIGFAAETDSEKLLDYARGKLEKKGADAICANQISKATGDQNQITWVGKDAVESWEMTDKRTIGHKIGLKLAGML